MSSSIGMARYGPWGGRWRIPAGTDLEEAVAREVFGWSDFRRAAFLGGIQVSGMPPGARDVHDRCDVPRYSRDFGAMWSLVEYMACQMGYGRLGYRWQGPLFKPEQSYLTHEGYGSGTTCWYVAVEEGGHRWFVCAETPMLATCWAALEVTALRGGVEMRGER